jgi:hypothetical protein
MLRQYKNWLKGRDTNGWEQNGTDVILNFSVAIRYDAGNGHPTSRNGRNRIRASRIFSRSCT